MGAPGIEAENPGSTMFYLDPHCTTAATGLQVFLTTTTYSAPLRPPTNEPGLSHHYKRASAHE
jgi:hypothetical protein